MLESLAETLREHGWTCEPPEIGGPRYYEKIGSWMEHVDLSFRARMFVLKVQNMGGTSVDDVRTAAEIRMATRNAGKVTLQEVLRKLPPDHYRSPAV